MVQNSPQRQDNMKQYTPGEKEKEAAPAAGSDGAIAGSSRSTSTNPQHLEGIALRRNIGIERKNREPKKVYIEAEILQALGPCDLNFQVNLALEHIITKHPRARVAVQSLDD